MLLLVIIKSIRHNKININSINYYVVECGQLGRIRSQIINEIDEGLTKFTKCTKFQNNYAKMTKFTMAYAMHCV